jgi:predicted ArsR family transcriptional regulator
VSYFLQQHTVAKAGDIAEWLGVEEEVVRCCLANLEQSGQVEALRPFGRSPGAQPDMDYFRWRQTDDQRYLWQSRLHQQRTLSLRELKLALMDAV